MPSEQSSRNSKVALAALAALLAGVALGLGSGLVPRPWQADALTGSASHVDVSAVSRSCSPSRPDGLRVLVTGAAGFVGFHASARLALRGDGVAGLDSFNAYYPASLKLSRSRLLRSRHSVHTVNSDLSDRAALQRSLSACSPTHVLHLAAQAGVRHAKHDPLSYVHSNVHSFVVLEEELAKLNPIPRLIFASSSSIYGGNDKVPFAEADCTEKCASSSPHLTFICCSFSTASSCFTS